MNTIILIPTETKARKWGALSRKASRKLADKIQHEDKAGSATLKKKIEENPLRENCMQFFGLN